MMDRALVKIHHLEIVLVQPESYPFSLMLLELT